MARFALIKDGVFERFEITPNRPANIPHKNIVWLPVVVVDAPVDPLTEVRLPRTYTIDIPGDQYIITRNKRAMTQAELDEVAEGNRSVDIKASLQQMLNGAGNTATRLSRLEDAVSWMLRKL